MATAFVVGGCAVVAAPFVICLILFDLWGLYSYVFFLLMLLILWSILAIGGLVHLYKFLFRR